MKVIDMVIYMVINMVIYIVICMAIYIKVTASFAGPHSCSPS